MPAAQLSAFVLVRCVVGDFLAKSIEHEEYKTSTWRNDPLSFARSSSFPVAKVYMVFTDISIEFLFLNKFGLFCEPCQAFKVYFVGI